MLYCNFHLVEEQTTCWICSQRNCYYIPEKLIQPQEHSDIFDILLRLLNIKEEDLLFAVWRSIATLLEYSVPFGYLTDSANAAIVDKLVKTTESAYKQVSENTLPFVTSWAEYLNVKTDSSIRKKEMNSDTCGFCGKHRSTDPTSFKRCARCSQVVYCSKDCQAKDWKQKHKMECKPKQ